MKEDTINIRTDEEPILVHENKEALRHLESHFEYALRQLQLIIDEYRKAAGITPAMEELASWFGQYTSDFMVAKRDLIRESILKALYIQQKAKYPELQFNYDNVPLPDLGNLSEAVGQLIFAPGIENKEYFFWDAYRIVNGKVEMVPEAVERAKDMWRCWAATAEEKKRLAEMRKLCTLLDTIKIPDPNMLNIAGFVSFDGDAFAPREYYIKGYFNQPKLIIDF